MDLAGERRKSWPWIWQAGKSPDHSKVQLKSRREVGRRQALPRRFGIAVLRAQRPGGRRRPSLNPKMCWLGYVLAWMASITEVTRDNVLTGWSSLVEGAHGTWASIAEVTHDNVLAGMASCGETAHDIRGRCSGCLSVCWLGCVLAWRASIAEVTHGDVFVLAGFASLA